MHVRLNSGMFHEALICIKSKLHAFDFFEYDIGKVFKVKFCF